MSKKILIVSQSHLCKNPRVLKESKTLKAAGYNVSILTSVYCEKLLYEDLELLKNTEIDYFFYSNLIELNVYSFLDRAVRKIAMFCQNRFNLESKLSLGYGVLRLLRNCLKFDPDLYIMHQELPTVIGCELIRQKRNVAFDFEDWYSKDLLSDARKNRPLKLLENAEKYALENGSSCWTTSRAMANGLKEYYQLAWVPGVIYNSFNTVLDFGLRESNKVLKLYWISQTIGCGRGLEFVINAISQCDFPINLVLRGDISSNFFNTLSSALNPKDRLTILPQIPFNEITLDLYKYDYGVASDLNIPESRNLTITNKLFYYLSSGMPVLASDTMGHKEILTDDPLFGFVYDQSDVKSLVRILNQIGVKHARGNFHSSRTDLVSHYAENYCWQLEQEKLLKLINRSFF